MSAPTLRVWSKRHRRRFAVPCSLQRPPLLPKPAWHLLALSLASPPCGSSSMPSGQYQHPGRRHGSPGCTPMNRNAAFRLPMTGCLPIATRLSCPHDETGRGFGQRDWGCCILRRTIEVKREYRFKTSQRDRIFRITLRLPIDPDATARLNVLDDVRSEKLQHDVNDLRLPLPREAEPTFLEHFQHCGVVRQNLRDEFFEPRITGNRDEMPHESRPETLRL